MEIRHETITRTTKSFDSIRHTFATDAPKTFHTPISLVRCSAVKDDKPNIPRQLIKIASTEKKVVNLPIRSSSPNFLAYSLSTNLYSKGASIPWSVSSQTTQFIYSLHQLHFSLVSACEDKDRGEGQITIYDYILFKKQNYRFKA